MSYVFGPKPDFPRGAALSVLWLEEQAPPPAEAPPSPPPSPNSGPAHDVAVARAKARLVQRREAQRKKKLSRTTA